MRMNRTIAERKNRSLFKLHSNNDEAPRVYDFFLAALDFLTDFEDFTVFTDRLVAFLGAARLGAPVFAEPRKTDS